MLWSKSARYFRADKLYRKDEGCTWPISTAGFKLLPQSYMRSVAKMLLSPVSTLISTCHFNRSAYGLNFGLSYQSRAHCAGRPLQQSYWNYSLKTYSKFTLSKHSEKASPHKMQLHREGNALHLVSTVHMLSSLQRMLPVYMICSRHGHVSFQMYFIDIPKLMDLLPWKLL